MKITHLFMALLAMVVLASCESEPSETLQKNIETESAYSSTFDPSNSVIPFPNDLLFRDSLDGTLNIPVADVSDLSDPQVALNALDGFSTNAPFSAGFTGPIDPASVPASVRVFEVTLSSTPGGAVVALNSELTFGVDFFATVSSINPNDLVILPLRPLKPKTSYQVVVTNALLGGDGKAMLPSVSYALVKDETPFTDIPSEQLPLALSTLSAEDFASIEGLRQLVSTSEKFTVQQATNPTLSKFDIILSWSFTTQSIDDVLAATRTQVKALTTTAGFGPTSVSDSPLGAATIHVGVIEVPYFLTAAASTTDATALNSFWQGAVGSHLTQYNTAAVATSTQTIPLMVSIPKSVGACAGGMPVAGWPVVIFQHGITRNRSDIMTVADSLAGACMAVVAIDMPMHGVTGLETNGTQAFKNPAINGGERTFDLDVVTQDTSGNVTAYAGDGIIDSSGINFINLANLLNTRDNVRQAASDLFVLVDAIEEGTITDGANIVDPDKIYFLGHSLGAMVGTSFLALEPGVRDAALAMGGSALAKILDGSSSFGAVVAGGLAAKGVLKGTSDYESFLGAAQTVVDSSDPVNYSLDAGAPYAPSAASGRGLMFVEIVGDSVLGKPSDLTVPNTVPDANDASGTIPAPLAGSEPQIALLGLTHVNATAGGADLLVVTKFTSGYHGSLLDPALDPLADAAVTTEIQTQIANFLGSDGAALFVTDDTVLQAPAP